MMPWRDILKWWVVAAAIAGAIWYEAGENKRLDQCHDDLRLLKQYIIGTLPSRIVPPSESTPADP